MEIFSNITIDRKLEGNDRKGKAVNWFKGPKIKLQESNRCSIIEYSRIKEKLFLST